MDETTKRRLNPTETVITYLPILIEVFVEYYGEEERENITTKFTNTLPLGYSLPNDIEGIIRQSKQITSNEITENFLNRCTKNPEEKTKLKEIFFENFSFESSSHPIVQYINYKEKINTSTWQKNMVINFLNTMNYNVNEDNLDELIENGTFKSIDTLIPIYKEELKRYTKFKTEIKPYQDYIEKSLQYDTYLNRKYEKILIQRLKYLFTSKEYFEIKLKMLSKEFRLLELNSIYKEIIENYIGSNFKKTPLIESFSEENEEILKTGEEWKQESVKQDRIKYFKNLGLDLGDDYNQYINNPQANGMKPSIESIQLIKNIKEELYTKMMYEYYTIIPEYQKNRKKIASLKLAKKDASYNAKTFYNQRICISPNLKFKNNEYIAYPSMLLYINVCNFLDSNLIHELNHRFEMKLEKLENNEYKIISGFEEFKCKINNKNEMENIVENRKYELFSEIINELISQEINEILSQKGIYIFDTKENKKIKGTTEYERAKFLVFEFYMTYKKEIIEARKTGNMQILHDAVGKENFEELNQLVYEFKNSLYKNKNFTLLEEEILKGNIDTPEAIIYNELSSRRDNVLAKMKEHYQTQSKSR